MLSKSKIISLFIKILLLQLLLILAMGMKKTSFFVDEIWTFNLANSYYFPALLDAQGYFDKWLPGDFWKQLLVVAPEHRFAFGSVWYNQSMDVHPPLFYSIVHSICSIFPGEFSKWFVIAPNILFFIGTQVVLLLAGLKLFDRQYMALMPCLFYGFTLGAINSVLYLRMYMLVTFWCMLAFYGHLLILEKLHEEKVLELKNYILVFGAYLGGFLTHYYFVVYAFFLSAVFGIYVLTNKHYHIIRRYLIATFGAFTISVAVFPAMLRHIFGRGASGYRGAEALSNLYGSSFSTKLAAFLNFVHQELGGDILLLFLWVIIISAIIKLAGLFADVSVKRTDTEYKLNINFKAPKTEYEFIFPKQVYFALYAAVTTVLCFMVIAKITEIDDSRYIFMLYPTIILFSMFFLGHYIDYVCGNKYAKIIFVVVMTIISALPAMKQSNIKAQDNNMQPAINLVAEKYSDIPLIGVCQYESWHPIIEKALLLNKVERSYLIKADNLKRLKLAMEQLSEKPEKVLVFFTWDNEKKCDILLEETKQITGYKENELLYESGNQYNRGKLYLLKK